MSDSTGRVIVIGDVMTDVIVIPEGPLVRGSDRRAQITQRPGGSGANQAVWLGSMGTLVSFVARVGARDKPHLEAYLRGFHVDPVLIADPVKPSGILVVIVDAECDRDHRSVQDFARLLHRQRRQKGQRQIDDEGVLRPPAARRYHPFACDHGAGHQRTPGQEH